MKKIALIGTTILVIGALPVFIYVAGVLQNLRKKAAPATTLALTPPSLTKKVDDVFTMDVVIDTGENQVVAVEIHLTFDPQKLEAQTISNGPLFQNILISGIVEEGAASITVGAADYKQPVTGTGTAAVIRFKALAKTDVPTAVKFSSNSFVGGLGENATNVLTGSTPATVTITEDQIKPTPSPTLAPTATPTPQATQSATFKIISPSQTSTIEESKPTIQGKAPSGVSITLTIYSTPRTVTLTADANGNWSYTPDTPLETGSHDVVASYTDASGQTVTATTAFVVATQSLAGADVPVSGNAEITLLLLLLGSAFVVIGSIGRIGNIDV